jgi:hypothetical protein
VRIYFSHATNSSFAAPVAEVLRAALKHEIIFPHQDSLAPLEIRPLFQAGVIDLVVAEVSCPSTGQGIELAWAAEANIPILCIYRNTTTPSRALEMIDARLMPYDACHEVVGFIDNLY